MATEKKETITTAIEKHNKNKVLHQWSDNGTESNKLQMELGVLPLSPRFLFISEN